ncbi:thioredoxin family protein [Paenibacillus sp. N1-5-1-14]|uniref:thioredoxin family protein n=1 Tax=Paenibacillus radicibacter TaxID=2972488 RepID=UPI0021598E96|nr:thioredoxin family protein [Paenibacillus radicibacter]MCR8643977.1 thioredoxin family protein [Paenibacillus radicibacter]
MTSNPMTILFIKTDHCGVCDSVLEKTKDMLMNYPKVEFSLVHMQEHPEVASEYLIFTAPTILILIEGKEVYRAARFVRMTELEETIAKWYEVIFE